MSLVGEKTAARHRDAGPSLERTGAAYAVASRAIANLRAVFIVILVAFHASLAYLDSTVRPAAGFGEPPFQWLAFPIVDAHRWGGFDIYCAWEDVHVMSLMFFLSGLFVAPSLARKGPKKFVYDRLLRLGLPFLFNVAVLMPIAIFPVYRSFGGGADLQAYARAYLALPFLPNGPTWFLWLLLAFSVSFAAVYAVWPAAPARLARLASGARLAPGRYFLGLTLAAALAYAPLAMGLDPWGWYEHGLLAFQYSRPLLYAVYFVAGISVGAFGLERGLLSADGRLRAAWGRITLLAPLALFVWMGLTGVTLIYPDYAPAPMRLMSALSYALAGTSGFFFMMSTAVRHGVMRSRGLDLFSRNALGIFVLHYPFVVWVQYALSDLALHAFLKALAVFLVTIALSLAGSEAMRLSRIGARLIGEDPPARMLAG